jgi:hypothetical protein
MVATNSSFIQQPFFWDDKRSQAALMLASGEAKTLVAETVDVDRVTLYHWLAHPDFAAEVDRLSLMVHVASRAERLRIAMRVVKQRINEEGNIATEKDVLDWLKFAQSETDGARIDLSKLTELLTGESAVEHGPPQQLGAVIETTAIDSGERLSLSEVTADSSNSSSDEEMLNPS